jgi:hypothetical protein
MKSLNNNRMKTVTTRGIGILPIILSASAMLAFSQPLFAKTAPALQSKPHIEGFVLFSILRVQWAA